MTEKIWIPPPVMYIMNAATESQGKPIVSAAPELPGGWATTVGWLLEGLLTLHWDVLCWAEGEVPRLLGAQGRQVRR